MEPDRRGKHDKHVAVDEDLKDLIREHIVREFNIHFGYPRSDTCDTCDSLKLQIEQAAESEKAALQKKHEDHLPFAKCGYETLGYDQNLSKQAIMGRFP